jgi:hypothetical protein
MEESILKRNCYWLINFIFQFNIRKKLKIINTIQDSSKSKKNRREKNKPKLHKDSLPPSKSHELMWSESSK